MTDGEQLLALTFPKAAKEASVFEAVLRQVDGMANGTGLTELEAARFLARALEQPGKPFSVHFRLRTAEQLEAQRRAIAKIVAAGHRPPDTLGQALARCAAENA